MEVAQSSETVVSSHHTTRCNNPENHKFGMVPLLTEGWISYLNRCSLYSEGRHTRVWLTSYEADPPQMLPGTNDELHAQVLIHVKKTEISYFLLWRHFRVRPTNAFHWTESELPNVSGKLEEFFYMYQVISLL